MIINKVEINNFYCFISDEIPFKKGLNIISAKNHGGKSQFFNAFYWTFFNKIYVDVNEKSTEKVWKDADKIIVCPEKLINDKEIGELIETSIAISLNAPFVESNYDNTMVDYVFEKKAVFKKNDKQSVDILGEPELTISYVKDGETIFIQSHQQEDVLNSIFPVSIRKFMWYQGESMDDLYDFNRPETLNHAINEISYFPIYDNMEKVVELATESIEKKINKELRKQGKLTNKHDELITDINKIRDSISAKSNSYKTLDSNISSIEDDLAEIEYNLDQNNQYSKFKEKLVKIDFDILRAQEKLKDSDHYFKETLINKWMLNGCLKLIKASKNNLNILSDEIQVFQKSNNPVPMSLPGPEYIQKMLTDKTCYICERDVDIDTDAYEALKKRLNEFDENANYKILQDNYTDINRAKNKLIKVLPDITEEINEEGKKKAKLLKSLTKLNKSKKALYEEAGVSEKVLSVGATEYSVLMSKHKTFRNTLENKKKHLDKIKNELHDLNLDLKNKMLEQNEIVTSVDVSIIENDAKKYIDFLNKSIGELRETALKRLKIEITEESNILYSAYLGGKQQGNIVIDDSVYIVDKLTGSFLTNLNTAEVTAQKIAVANAFLSLSAKKMNKSYPIVADAPTSNFDPENTYSLTKNIGNSFEQMIIMSKDYSGLSNEQRNNLIKEANISKYYEFKNEIIDESGPDSRINKKTFITTIK